MSLRIRVIKVGKPAEREYQALVDNFIKRLSADGPVESVIVKASHGRQRSEKQLQSLLTSDKAASSQQLVVALDERGRSLSSTALAGFLQEHRDQGRVKTLNLIIGGPYGLSEELRREVDLNWRLSDMVLPSDMAWLILWEQLYRAFSIMKGTPYHHDG